MESPLASASPHEVTLVERTKHTAEAWPSRPWECQGGMSTCKNPQAPREALRFLGVSTRTVNL